MKLKEKFAKRFGYVRECVFEHDVEDDEFVAEVLKGSEKLEDVLNRFHQNEYSVTIKGENGFSLMKNGEKKQRKVSFADLK